MNIRTILLLLPNLLIQPASANEAEINGSYIHVTELRNDKLLILNSKESRFDFEISTNWKLSKEATPTIGYFSGTAERKSGLAMAKIKSDMDECFLVFRFINPRSIEVKSFGDCYHGHNAYPDLIYQRKPNSMN